MIDGLPIASSKTVLVGIKIDQEFKFNDHDNYLGKKKQVKNLIQLPVLHVL